MPRSSAGILIPWGDEHVSAERLSERGVVRCRRERRAAGRGAK